MIDWLEEYRSVFHKLEGGISADSPVLSGVPQGTVLGPLLFLIMIINKDISESNLISFADDTQTYTKIHDVSDCNLLQQDLNHIYDWATTNNYNMFFNAQKFHYITFSSKESSCLSNIYINPELNIINPSSEVLDLGVYMSSNCTFDFHVSCVYKRCSNLSGLILRTFSTRETRTMMTLFKSLVLSRLDYASQLWCCCCLPTPMALASGGSPMFPLVVHQPASPSTWPAVQSLRRGLSTNSGATMWCVCGCS